MTFPVRAELAGDVDQSAMEAALRVALDRHPLLTCRAARRWGRWCWLPSDEGRPTLAWQVGPAPKRVEIRAIDPRSDSPLEARVFVDGTRVVLDLLFHHAACDGIGAMVFLGDVLAAYAQRLEGDHPPARLLSLSPDLLRVRSRFEIHYPREYSVSEAIQVSLRETAKVMLRWPSILASSQPRGRSPKAADSTMFVGKLDADAFTRFTHRAEQLNVTANDLLLRDLLLTVHQWNREHGDRRRGWLRVNVPTSLRARRDLRMPAANILGYALLTLHNRQCEDRDGLLRSIAEDMKSVRDWSMGSFFVEALRTPSAIPGGMWLGTRLMRRSATVVFSNVGDATRRFRARLPRVDGHTVAGNLRLVSIAGTPPVRPGTRLAMALSVTAGVPSLGIHADSRFLSEDDVQQFFAQFADRIRQSAEEHEDADK